MQQTLVKLEETMRKYIDHFEIQTQRPGQGWKHLSNAYPEYKWRIWRPWYFFCLVRRCTITNEIETWTTLFSNLTRNLVALPGADEKVRLVVFVSHLPFIGIFVKPLELIRAGAMEPC